MKKLAAVMVAFVMALLLASGAFAAGSVTTLQGAPTENSAASLQDATAEDTLMLFYDAAAELMFETSNVTLDGHAVFSLDGERFKTADLHYVQNYTNSLYKLDLQTPRRDGTKPDRESGYTIIANGEYVYVIEVIYPGVYKTGTTGAQSTILRKTVQMNLMTDMARMLAGQAEDLLGEKAVMIQPTREEGKELTVVLSEDVPELVNTALNLFYQFAAKRYFRTDYDQISEAHMTQMENYMTVTEGILWTTKSVSLKGANLLMRVNDQGQAEELKGDVSLLLYTGRDGERQMDVSFELKVSDRDSSFVGSFDPAEYGVEKAK